jgi:hypothetical protein
MVSALRGKSCFQLNIVKIKTLIATVVLKALCQQLKAGNRGPIEIHI